MKRSVIICLLVLMSGFTVQAQSYETLWKQVEEYNQKGLPQSATDASKKIYAKAEKEGNIPQMMKAYLTAMTFRGEISPDSMTVDMEKLETWAEEEQKPEYKAVLYSILGEKTIGKNFEKGNEFLKFSLADSLTLQKYSVKKLAPLAQSGETSIRYFKDNLYDLLARRAIQAWESCRRGSLFSKAQKAIENTRQSLLRFYKREKNREAWLLTALEMEAYPPEKQLRTWIEEYGDLEVCAEVYAKLADYRYLRDDYMQQLDLLREAIRKYPQYNRINILKNKEMKILSPQLSIIADHGTLYPGKELDVAAHHKNITGFTLQVYELGLSADSPDLKHVNVDNVAEYGKLIRKEHFKLEPSLDYKKRKSELKVKALATGIYYFVAVPDEGKEVQGQVVHISKLHIIHMKPHQNTYHFAIVDKVSGKPVEDAELVTYKNQNDTLVRLHSFKTRKYGLLSIGKYKPKRMIFHAQSPDDKAMEIKNVWINDYTGKKDTTKYERIQCYTDRYIYRPGQAVHFSGIVFDQRRDSVEVAENRKVTLRLKTNRDKEISREEAVTDNLGVFSGEFLLPKDIEPGIYQIDIGGVNHSIRVEEYKRPTFDVTFEPVKVTYQAGDSITVTGVARTFAGAPVQNAKVEYTLRKNECLWWREDGIGSEVSRGTLTTDSEGRFHVPVCFEQEAENDHSWFWNYRLKADVTGVSGETQSGALNLPIGCSSLALRIGEWGWTTIYTSYRKPLRFDVVNMRDEEVDVPVAYRIYEWKKDDNGKEVKGECLYADTVKSNETVMPDELYSLLPSGKYILEAVVKDNQARECRAKATFTLFSATDQKTPYKSTAWCYQSSDVFEGKKPIVIAVGSSEKDVHLYCTFSYGKVRKTALHVFSDSLMFFRFPYKEEYDEGATFSFAFVKNGKLHERTFRMVKPLPKKKNLQLKWKTFRDRLYPGQQEEWTLQITNTKAKANLMAVMYDASLDKLLPYNWRVYMSFERYAPGARWWNWAGKNYSVSFSFPFKPLDCPSLSYSFLDMPTRSGKTIYVKGTRRAGNTSEELKRDVTGSMAAEVKYVPVEVDNDWGYEAMTEDATPSIRQNFNETAFFYPNLRTDENGEVKISFTLPESLTTWKFMGLAHTKDMDYGQITAQAVASKEFMLQPNTPRFVRTGDEVSLSASLINLSEEDVIGNVRMELFNPVTDKVYLTKKQRFLVTPKATTTVHFGFEVSEEYTDLAVRWIAEGEHFSDGEQRPLPVLSNKQWITESVPLYINGEGTSTFSLESLFNHHSKSIRSPKMTVEFTGNPAWYAVQALPVLTNPKYEDALSWATAYYANALTKHLAKTHPDIAHRLDVDTLGFRTAKAIAKLMELQNADGSWSWYKGMDGNRYITTQVAELLARLLATPNYKAEGRELTLLKVKAMVYLDKEAKREYDRMKKAEKEGAKNLLPSESVLRYLYICALSDAPVNDVMHSYFIDKLANLESLGELTIYGKAAGAIIMHRAGKEEKAKEMLQSIREYSVYTDEMGRYFDTPLAQYSWFSYKIPTQVMAIEAVHQIANDVKTVDEMKRWLLQQKRTQDWRTPIATADAVYALLNIGDNALENTGECQLILGKTKIDVTKNDTLAYVKQTIDGKVTDIREVTVKKQSPGIGWGAVYAEYQEDMDKVGTQGNALSIRKEIYKDGKPLAEGETLKVGDKLTVHLTVRADRDMDFVEVKDERAACLEPVDMLSGYRWKDGIGYYQTTKDSSTSFFMDQMRKGTYTLQYEVYVNLAGTYQGGAATIQSVYVPEFNGHEGGTPLSVP